MPKPRSKVTEAVRTIASDMIDDGGGRASDGAARFQQQYPELIHEFGTTLAMSQIANLLRAEFKRSTSDGGAQQLSIPGLTMARFKKLPLCISVPTEDGDAIYRPLHRATMGELAACIGARSEQLQQDAAVLRDLRELHAERTQQGAEDDDLVFQPAERSERRASDQPGAQPPP